MDTTKATYHACSMHARNSGQSLVDPMLGSCGSTASFSTKALRERNVLVDGQQNWVLRTDVLSHVLSHFSLCGLKEKNKYSCIKVQSDKTAIDNLVYTAKVETQTWRANVRILRGKEGRW